MLFSFASLLSFTNSRSQMIEEFVGHATEEVLIPLLYTEKVETACLDAACKKLEKVQRHESSRCSTGFSLVLHKWLGFLVFHCLIEFTSLILVNKAIHSFMNQFLN